MLEAGAQAPDFPVGDGRLYDLLKQGPVVVWFFPKAFTPG